MKTFTSIDLFVQALLLLGLLGSSVALLFEAAYAPFFFLLLFVTGVWQLSSATFSSLIHTDRYKSLFLAASAVYCGLLVGVGTSGWFAFEAPYRTMTQVTFLGIIPVFAALLYFYLCVEGYNRWMAAKKKQELL
jgi:hypothetical protein